jgi:hypothetical protein
MQKILLNSLASAEVVGVAFVGGAGGQDKMRGFLPHDFAQAV